MIVLCFVYISISLQVEMVANQNLFPHTEMSRHCPYNLSLSTSPKCRYLCNYTKSD
ncbi:hypothetical protein RchiOBHm_Chr7g0200761 [Rosa chinensis]|uniref:Uncharacterized protein n=1 Tax=Rosa chinensis TaxID=74649 RepID=A0A2P6P7U9_ROSCH|nr:hypothetical protein RchiOBHm_Chr7g0200761 [Rosa chinensis]